MEEMLLELSDRMDKTVSVLKEDFASFRKEWGYFSDKDGITHQFDLCEQCYDRITESFQIPVSVEDTRELL